jgi:hypothetical protein
MNKFAFALSMSILIFISCSTVTPAGQCEVSAIEQVVVSNGSGDITVIANIVAAVETGGAALPTLLTQLYTMFGTATVNCAVELADDIVNALENLGGSGVSPNPSLKTGIVVLHSEMDKRNLKHK